MKSKPKLTPPDKKQCQAEKPNGNTFMTLGGVPGIIATEIKPGKDGLVGSMSLCKNCFEVFQKQCPGKATFEVIK